MVISQYQWLSMVIDYQQVINGYRELLMVNNQLSMVIDCYQGLFISQYQWLSMVIGFQQVINGYQWLSMVIVY